MDRSKQPLSIQQIIHKESIKEKLKTKGLKPYGKRKGEWLKEDTLGETQMQMPNVQQTKGEHEINQELSTYRLEKLRKNSEIDAFLEQLLTTNMINQEYFAFHAKAIHTLTLTVCQKIYLNALNGTTPQKLYAFKIKGALQLHYKQQYDGLEGRGEL